MKSIFFSLAVLCTMHVHAQLSGTYIISSPTESSPTDDFPSLVYADSIYRLDTISAPVTFKLRNGVHPGIYRISSASETTPLFTLESLSGNRDSVITTIDGAFDAHQFTIKDITIHTKLNTWLLYDNKGMGIRRSTDFKFINCVFVGNKNDVFYKNGLTITLSKDYEVKNCLFTNHEYSLVLSGLNPFGFRDHDGFKNIDNNVFINSTNAMIFSGSFYDTLMVTNNSIDSAEIGINVSSNLVLKLNAKCFFANNKVTNASKFALHIGEVNNTNNYIKFTNNMFSSRKDVAFPNYPAVRANHAEYILFTQNSIYGMVELFDVTQFKSHSNAIYTDSSFALYFHDVVGYNGLNNAYFVKDSTSGIFKNNQTIYYDLESFKQALNSDVNSIYANPNFISSSDLHACSNQLLGAGKPGPELLFDFDHEPRSNTRPDIGCDEFKNADLKPCAFLEIDCDTSGYYAYKFINASPRFANSVWNFGDGNTSNSDTVIHHYTSPGTYQIQLISANAFGADTTYTTLNFAGVQPEQIQTNADTLFINSGHLNYQWYIDGVAVPNANNPYFIKAIGATYTVSFTNVNGCTQFSDKHNNLNMVENKFSKISIGPNPTNQFINITFLANNLKWVHVSLVDITGREILVKNAETDNGLNSIKLDLANFADGLYVLVLKSSDGQIRSSKIIKQ